MMQDYYPDMDAARVRIKELEAEVERLKGKWEKEGHRCPQCGTGNPRLADVERERDEAREENARLLVERETLEIDVRVENERLKSKIEAALAHCHKARTEFKGASDVGQIRLSSWIAMIEEALTGGREK